MKRGWLIILLALTLTAAAEEILPGTPGRIVVPQESSGGGGSPGGGREGIYYGGRFGFFLPFSQDNYLGHHGLAWRFEGFLNLEGGDWKALGTVGLYLGEVTDNPDFENSPGFWVVPVSLGAYYEFGDDFSPYLGGGVGFMLFSVGERDPEDGPVEDAFTELLFLPHLAAGLDIFRDKNFRLNTELRLELAWSKELGQVGGFSLQFGLAF